MVSYGELFFFRYVLQFQTETVSAPLVVRTPSAACKPWMSSGLVSIRTRITLSPSLVRRTASSAEKTTSETYKTCPTKSHQKRFNNKGTGTKWVTRCDMFKHIWKFRNDGNTDVKSSINRLHSITWVPFVQFAPRTLHVNICHQIYRDQSMCGAQQDHSEQVNNKWTTSEQQVNNKWTMGGACPHPWRKEALPPAAPGEAGSPLAMMSWDFLRLFVIVWPTRDHTRNAS